MLRYLFSITSVPPDSNSVVHTPAPAQVVFNRSVASTETHTHTHTHSLCPCAFCSSLPLGWRYLPFHLCSNISELKMNVHVFCEKSTRKTRKLTLSHPLYWEVKRWHVSKSFFFSRPFHTMFSETNKIRVRFVCLFFGSKQILKSRLVWGEQPPAFPRRYCPPMIGRQMYVYSIFD